MAFDGVPPPYVPWSFSCTADARQKLLDHFGQDNLATLLDEHFLGLGDAAWSFKDIGESCVEDAFNVVWDRSIDKDIGNVKGHVLEEPTLNGYCFPDPRDERYFESMSARIEKHAARFRVFEIGFSLYERAWALRGMQNLMLDFYDHPGFVHGLLTAIADWNIAQVQEALKHDIDCVYFGDDWGQQRGLQMGSPIWHEFIYPQLRRMYGVVREHGRYTMIHSCGDVDELFDDLVAIGLNCFNPFQPDVMDIESLMKRYHGQLAFWGGLSVQRTLPYGTPDDVRREAQHLIELGSEGGYILSPSHSVPKDVPLDNMVAFIEVARAQPGYPAG